MLNSDPKMSDSLNNMEFVRTSQLSRFGHFGMDQEFGCKRCLTYCCRYDDPSSDIPSQKFDKNIFRLLFPSRMSGSGIVRTC